MVTTVTVTPHTTDALMSAAGKLVGNPSTGVPVHAVTLPAPAFDREP